jgi:hypothetical protein
LCYNIIYDFDIEERGFNGYGEFMYSKLRFVNIQPNCYKQTFRSGTTYGSMVSTHILFQKLVNNIAENEKFMQFRDSCVTLLLSDSLRCSKVTIITCIASNDSKPEVDNLIFASRACFAKSFLRIGIRKFNFMF